MDLAVELERHGITLTAEEFLTAVAQTLDALRPPDDGVTAGELAYLRERGGSDAASALSEPSALERALADRTAVATRTAIEMIADSIDVPTAAHLLHLDRSSVNRRIQARTLWAFRVDGRNRLPRWQFTGDLTLPGLSVVVPAIPDGAAPVAVAAAMTAPQQELDGASAIEHLAAGGDPAPVAELLAESGQW